MKPLRKCFYENEVYDFHEFYTKFDVIGDSPMVGGYRAGQLSFHMAVIERDDGSIIYVHSHKIKFIVD